MEGTRASEEAGQFFLCFKLLPTISTFFDVTAKLLQRWPAEFFIKVKLDMGPITSTTLHSLLPFDEIGLLDVVEMIAQSSPCLSNARHLHSRKKARLLAAF